MARALLLIGMNRPLRVLCARELQKSIEESVHKVLSDQISRLGLDHFYEVQKNHIYGKNGTIFSFEGIKNNVNKIKSFEGIDICWVEEAVKVSKASWKILIPTIRKEKCPLGHVLPPADFDEEDDSNLLYQCPSCGEDILQSEIWMTFNPELSSDYTYKRFVEGADPKNSFVVKMTWRDNPWFPRVTYDEMLRDKKEDPDTYENVWEGNCIQTLEGAIYAKELKRAQNEGRICKVPYDKAYPVDAFFDLGRADATAIWFAQYVAMQYRILRYFADSLEDIDYYLRELQRTGYVFGTIWLPHDAKAKRLGTKLSIEEIVRQANYRVRIVTKLSPTDGINAARIIFPNCWFDAEKCEEGLNALRHYRYRVIDGQLSKDPLHDWASDGADAFRYMAVSLAAPRESSKVSERLAIAAANVLRSKTQLHERAGGGSRLGWMR